MTATEYMERLGAVFTSPTRDYDAFDRELDALGDAAMNIRNRASRTGDMEPIFDLAAAIFTCLDRHPLSVYTVTALALDPIIDRMNKRGQARLDAGVGTWSGLLPLDIFRDTVHTMQTFAVHLELEDTPLANAELSILAQLPVRLLKSTLLLASEVAPALIVATRGTEHEAAGWRAADGLLRITQLMAVDPLAYTYQKLDEHVARVVEVAGWRVPDVVDDTQNHSQLLSATRLTVAVFQMCDICTRAYAPASNPDSAAVTFEAEDILRELEDTMRRADKNLARELETTLRRIRSTAT